MKSSGMVAKNCRMRNVPKPVIMPGNMIPQYEFSQPKSFDMMNHGTISISVGIISVDKIAMKTIDLPRNLNLHSV